ncbi:hypothetical protein [Hymenobacter coccineus]|uniref:Uncharacterized protein n=1 Tax=Hymenobacter coccineus TaxID=1908235 RepID=A0A1G1STY9_9BACT|nr:hypothetical protein [Hymenobacter coccineus]OGX82082.1 hypothetical protein BEN49_02700 [Hymenobacter coccineus]
MLLPYRIVFDEENIAYFTADNRAKYKALFSGRPLPGLPELEGFVFDFSFQREVSDCTKPTHPGYDRRIRLTLEKLMNRFFEIDPYNVMAFVCEATDYKHKMRQRVFGDWHAAHRNRIAKVTFSLPSGTVGENGSAGESVGGLFYLKDHPLALKIESGLGAEIAYYTTIKAEY